MTVTSDILDSDKRSYIRRRSLLPWWIKTFAWIFMVVGFIGAPTALVFGLLNYKFDVSFLGLETNQPISITGIIVLIILFYKAIASLALMIEKSDAIVLALIDAAFSIAICLFTMFVYPHFVANTEHQLNLRIEIFVVIPYLAWLTRNKRRWEGQGVE